MYFFGRRGRTCCFGQACQASTATGQSGCDAADSDRYYENASSLDDAYVFCRPYTGPRCWQPHSVEPAGTADEHSNPTRPAAAGTRVRRQAAEGAGRSRFKFDLRGPAAQVFVFGKPV